MNMFAKGTAKTPEEYINQLPEEKQADMKELHALIQKTVPKLKPYMIGQIIGYGTYHYKGKSGREGEWCVIGLSARKNYFSVYACAVEDGKYVPEQHKAQLPKATVGKSCVSFKRNSDIDLKVLAQIIKESDEILKKNDYSFVA